jgi:hypothetical protein
MLGEKPVLAPLWLYLRIPALAASFARLNSAVSILILLFCLSCVGQCWARDGRSSAMRLHAQGKVPGGWVLFPQTNFRILCNTCVEKGKACQLTMMFVVRCLMLLQFVHIGCGKCKIGHTFVITLVSWHLDRCAPAALWQAFAMLSWMTRKRPRRLVIFSFFFHALSCSVSLSDI